MKNNCKECKVRNSCVYAEANGKGLGMKCITESGLYGNECVLDVPRKLMYEKYKDLSDKELIYRFKFLKDSTAINLLYERCIEVKEYHKRVNLNNYAITQDEIESCFNYLFYNSLDKYQAGRGCLYKSFISFVVRRGIIRIANTNKKIKEVEVLECDRDFIEGRSYLNPECAYMLKEDIKKGREVYSELNDIQKEILSNRIEKVRTYAQIGEAHNVSLNVVKSEAKKLTRIIKKREAERNVFC